MDKKYYGVRAGIKPGIYGTWEECKKQVAGYPGAQFKKFTTIAEAESYILGSPQEIEKDLESLKDKEASVYVDGSFDLATGSYSYGAVIITKNEKYSLSGRYYDPDMAQMRNVSGELKGAVAAMEWAICNGIETLYIHYDYTGIERWAKGDWKTNKDGTRAYKEYFDRIKDKLKVEFVKVKAHSGNKYNEEADKLAKDAI